MRWRMRIGAGVVSVCASVCTAVLLAGCTAAPDPAGSGGGGDAKNGDTAPLAGTGDAARRPVPQGRGSRLPDDFNGDGHRDLVLNDLVKAADDSYGDDAGIGIVYGTGAGGSGASGTARGSGGGTGTGRGSGAALDPAVRQILGPRTHGARVGGTLPAAFDAMAACDLDKDGYGDLVIATDPPYDGTGMPPVPLQLLFGGPSGLTGRAVVLRIPGQARFGNEWPDHPVCGDFDGDGSVDLAVTASAGRVSFLRGPFSRAGAPRSASAPVPGGGPALEAPAPAADADGDGYDDLVYSARAHAPGTAARGALLLGGPDGPGRAGGSYRFKAVGLPPAPALPNGKGGGESATEVLVSADFTGDERPDLVTRTHRGETADVIAVYEGTGGGTAGADWADGGTGGETGGGTGGGKGGGTGGGFADRPVLTFSTSLFLK
ncbi:FG-GAP-like repeat-containing protein [Streptomyces sp. GMY02]|uniref:FG-GAP-like repeat-containing protein n=1 Tax=Streptomyces sp. GMY02 TaxID=1333528 RepID=UPI0020B63DD0|nr:FG-GAP-like repeat-containing protein [Streptomyces sp. GMY02]